jgi:hypothetical protein
MIKQVGVRPAEVLGFILYVHECFLKYLRFDRAHTNPLQCVQCEVYTTGHVLDAAATTTSMQDIHTMECEVCVIGPHFSARARCLALLHT